VIIVPGLRSCEGHHYQPETSTLFATVTCREIQGSISAIQFKALLDWYPVTHNTLVLALDNPSADCSQIASCIFSQKLAEIGGHNLIGWLYVIYVKLHRLLSVRQEHSWYFSQQRFQEELANGFAECNVHGIKSLCEFSLKQSVFGILLCYKLYLMHLGSIRYFKINTLIKSDFYI